MLTPEEEIRIDLSEPIIQETLGFFREKFKWDGYSINDARRKLESLANIVVPTETLNIIVYDPPDDRILECAIAARSDFIVTDDKDLLKPGLFTNARIVKFG